MKRRILFAATGILALATVAAAQPEQGRRQGQQDLDRPGQRQQDRLRFEQDEPQTAPQRARDRGDRPEGDIKEDRPLRDSDARTLQRGPNRDRDTENLRTPGNRQGRFFNPPTPGQRGSQEQFRPFQSRGQRFQRFRGPQARPGLQDRQGNFGRLHQRFRPQGPAQWMQRPFGPGIRGRQFEYQNRAWQGRGPGQNLRRGFLQRPGGPDQTPYGQGPLSRRGGIRRPGLGPDCPWDLTPQTPPSNRRPFGGPWGFAPQR